MPLERPASGSAPEARPILGDDGQDGEQKTPDRGPHGARRRAAMSLALIGGPPNSGRTGLVLDRFEAAIESDPILIVPTGDDVERIRRHPDVRIARRAQTIARLAQIIAGRDVKAGLRRALKTQAARLSEIAEQRFTALGGEGAVETRSADDGSDGDGA